MTSRDTDIDNLKQRTKVKFKKDNSTFKVSSSTPGGIDSSVIAMLKNYEPASIHKKPFWCRVCRFQADSMRSYTEHLASTLHIETSKVERKMSGCKLCKKEFTSPDQLQEHLRGKLHKGTLQRFQRNDRSSMHFN